MKPGNVLGWSSALCLCVLSAQAQETNEVEKLSRQLQQIQQTFEKQQREMRESFERMLREQQAQIDALKQQLAAATNAAGGAAPTNAPPAAEQWQQLNQKVDQVVEGQKKIRPSEFNPAIGFVGETVLSYRTRGDQITNSRPAGFDAFQRSMELNIAASVDPFAKGYAVINATADSATGDATLGFEEAALQTTSLPWNLEVKAGRFFAEFGRLAYIHDHELPFVNRPLALDQYIGGESKTDGLQVNWLPPIGHYMSLSVGAGDQFGDDPNNPGTYRPFSELNFWGRLSSYFDLTPNWQLEGGLSGLWNPRTEDRGGALPQPGGGTLTEKERRLAGLDLKLSYVPLRNNQFQSFTWGTELLFSDNRYLFDPDGAPPIGEEFFRNVESFGLYSYASYKWHRQWSAGFLFDWVQDAQNHNDVTFAYSPFVTWALSHWNQLRLQYTHTDHNGASGLRPDDAIYLQWAWIIGSHAHGWQQR